MGALKELKGSLNKYKILLLVIALLIGVGLVVYYVYLDRDSGISMLGIRIASVIGLYTSVWVLYLIFGAYRRVKDEDLSKVVKIFLIALTFTTLSMVFVSIGIIIWRMWAIKLFLNIFLGLNIVTFILLTFGLMKKVKEGMTPTLVRVYTILFTINVIAAVLFLLVFGRAFQPIWVFVLVGLYIVVFGVIHAIRLVGVRKEILQVSDNE